MPRYSRDHPPQIVYIRHLPNGHMDIYKQRVDPIHLCIGGS
jgi:hypothetical protein